MDALHQACFVAKGKQERVRMKVKTEKKRNTQHACYLDGKLMDAMHQGALSKRETRNASTFNFRQLVSHNFLHLLLRTNSFIF